MCFLLHTHTQKYVHLHTLSHNRVRSRRPAGSGRAAGSRAACLLPRHANRANTQRGLHRGWRNKATWCIDFCQRKVAGRRGESTGYCHGKSSHARAWRCEKLVWKGVRVLCVLVCWCVHVPWCLKVYALLVCVFDQASQGVCTHVWAYKTRTGPHAHTALWRRATRIKRLCMSISYKLYSDESFYVCVCANLCVQQQVHDMFQVLPLNSWHVYEHIEGFEWL